MTDLARADQPAAAENTSAAQESSARTPSGLPNSAASRTADPAASLAAAPTADPAANLAAGSAAGPAVSLAARTTADLTASSAATVGGGAAAPLTPTELGVARAAALFERVDPAKAAALLENVLAMDAASAEGWTLMSRIRLTLDEAGRALDAAAKAIALVPEDARPLAAASRALTLLGRHEEAVTMAYRAVIVEPKNPLWHDRVAWALLAADRQIADAEQAARTAIGLNPHEAHYYFTHGVTLDALGHADQARQALLISLRLEPENPVAQHRLALLNGEVVRAEPRKRRSWRLFGRRADDAGKTGRPEEYL
jgi:tetratricopeptide (TPR) repeat protein